MGEPSGPGQASPHGKNPNPCRKQLWNVLFKLLLLLCLALIFCYSVTNLSWAENSHHNRIPKGFFSLAVSDYRPPPYRVDPKHKQARTNAPTTAAAPERTQYHQAYPKNYGFILDAADACNLMAPFLVLMVPVAPEDVKARNAIRQTWAKEKVVLGEPVLTLFVLGVQGGAEVEEAVRREAMHHDDVIQSSFQDSYHNLTIKTMVIMDWLATFCPAAPFAMKVDSDMFLNVDNLVVMLKRPETPRSHYLTGILMWNRPVVRSKTSKWYVPEELYPESTYPTYALGMGYVFSNDLPAMFVAVSQDIRPFSIEDAYIGMCMKKLGLKLTPPPQVSQFKAYLDKYDRCSFSKVITYILPSADALLRYWADLKKPGSPCPTQKEPHG